MKEIPKSKTIVVAFSGGESSAYMLKLILDKYRDTHKIIVCFCNTGEEDEETLVFTQKISEYFNVEIVWLEYRRKRKVLVDWNGEEKNKSDFSIVDFNSAYRITNNEAETGYKNHPFLQYVEDYGLPQYPNRTCTREMKERTITRYLSNIGIMPRMCVRCVGIRFDEIANRMPDPKQYYELILQGITKPMINRLFEYEMPFRLNLPSYLGNCGACISKSLRNLCTIMRDNPNKFKFFSFLSSEFGLDMHTFYREHTTIQALVEMSKDLNIKNARDNRFDFEYQTDLFFDSKLDTEGACGGTCEAFA